MKHLRKIMLLSACLLGLTVFAQQNPPAKPGGEHQHGGQKSHEMGSVDDHLKELTARLNLTSDQQAKVKTFLEEHQQQMDTLMKDQSLSKEDKHTKAEGVHDSFHSKVREVLTDDQKKTFDAMVKEHEQAHEHGKGHDSDKHQ